MVCAGALNTCLHLMKEFQCHLLPPPPKTLIAIWWVELGWGWVGGSKRIAYCFQVATCPRSVMNRRRLVFKSGYVCSALLHSRSSLASFMCVRPKAASWRAVVGDHDNGQRSTVARFFLREEQWTSRMMFRWAVLRHGRWKVLGAAAFRNDNRFCVCICPVRCLGWKVDCAVQWQIIASITDFVKCSGQPNLDWFETGRCCRRLPQFLC